MRTFTPFRLSRVPVQAAAKAAIPAKAGGSERQTFAAFAAFAASPRANDDPDAAAERVAIIEEGAKVPREWAEGFAKLEATPAPAGVDPAQWLAVINAAGRFLDEWGAKAAALGWTAGELFGLNPNAPLSRRDRRGAAFFLANVEVAAITAEAITLHSGRNVLRLYRRDGFNAPAWETLGDLGH